MLQPSNCRSIDIHKTFQSQNKLCKKYLAFWKAINTLWESLKTDTHGSLHLVFMVRMTSKYITISSKHTNHCRFYLLLTSVNPHNVQNKPQPTDFFVPKCLQMSLCYNICHRRCYTPKKLHQPRRLNVDHSNTYTIHAIYHNAMVLCNSDD